MEIHGIPCTLREPRSRQAAARVLRKIKNCFPRDFARLFARVRLIRPLPKKKFTNCEGKMLALTPSHDGQRRLVPLDGSYACEWDDIAEAIVEIKESRRMSDTYLIHLVAHELGHACTRGIDIERRNAPDMEWGSEAAADWYVWKWGLGVPQHTAIGHHGGQPGHTIEVGSVGTFNVSRNYVYKRIGDSSLTVADILGEQDQPFDPCRESP